MDESLINSQIIGKREMNPNSLKNLVPFQFKKGEVSNPNGRPKKDRCYSDILKEFTDAQKINIELTFPDGKKKNWGMEASTSFLHAIAAGMIREALSGNTTAAENIVDRLEGKVRNKIDIISDIQPMILNFGPRKSLPNNSLPQESLPPLLEANNINVVDIQEDTTNK